MKHILTKLAAVCSSALLLLTGCTENPEQSAPSAVNTNTSDGSEITTEFKISSFDVGKGDAFLLQTADNAVMIDTGYQSDGKSLTKKLMKNGVSTINTLIITHFDKDHVGGAAKILNSLKVENIYVPDYISDSDEYKEFKQAADKSSATLNVMKAADSTSWQAGEVTYRLYAPNDTFYGKDEENDYSLALYIQHGANTFLFPGDAENTRMQELINLGLGAVTFLKFPYHGNYLKKTETFLDAYAPKYTIVTSSDKEPAESSTIETLKKRGVEAYYMQNGDVTVLSDGKTLTCTQK